MQGNTFLTLYHLPYSLQIIYISDLMGRNGMEIGRTQDYPTSHVSLYILRMLNNQ